MTMPTATPSPFGETASLLEVFAEAKKRRGARAPAHVLLVEDDPLTRRMVTSSLKETYAMISACNAHEAVADYLMHAPDVVFLDIGLPDKDGFAVLQQIMAIDPDAFVVMFSSNLYPDNVRKAEAAGAKGFVPKPFRREDLHRYIQGSAVHYHKWCT